MQQMLYQDIRPYGCVWPKCYDIIKTSGLRPDVFIVYDVLEVNSDSEEEISGFSVDVFNKIAETVFVANFQ